MVLERAERHFGIVLLLAAAVVFVALVPVLEIALYIGSAIMAVAGLALLAGRLFRWRGAYRLVLPLLGVLLGSLLAIHDLLFAPGIAYSIHISLGAIVATFGILQLLSRTSLARKLLVRKR